MRRSLRMALYATTALTSLAVMATAHANDFNGLGTLGGTYSGCPSRKLNPRVAMMQPKQNWHSDNGSASLDRATERSILIQ
jgi:hypothetical protein